MQPPWSPSLRAGLRGAPRRVTLARPGRLWRLEDDAGALWLKRCASTRAAAAEAHVLRAGLPGVARLRALDLPARCLLMEELPGEDLESIELTENLALSFAAGRWLTQLHALPVEEHDPLPLEQALARRLEGLLSRLDGTLEGLPVTALREATAALRLGDARRVWCHRDFQPQNWRWDGNSLGVLDFEHARPDLWLTDLAKLEASHWRGRPAARRAFLEGYGRSLSGDEAEALRVLVGLEGLFALTWGRQHGDAAFIALGEGVLARWR